ncbi:phage tail protein [Phycicoccus flavus]|uniref:phage tail protein n=1 Tax=Phycicoccus flavus TaxID=2502783 RepID=UPI000FEB77F6|nr:tail fiber protein [Phycicoccus flavus]NHA67137.1 phage tail protein [Phycicoccus flavus]
MDPILGEIRLFGFGFAPVGWALCQGQMMSIPQNTALFSLLGTTYGGDGRTTFALPDLRGRIPMGAGDAPGLTPRRQGQAVGSETVTLDESNLPRHSHTVNATSNAAETKSASGAYLAYTDGSTYLTQDTAPDLVLNAGTIGTAGASTPAQTVPPSLVLSWCIAVQGVYPSRG